MRLLLVPVCLMAAGSLRVCDSAEKASGAVASAAAVASGSLAGSINASLAAPRIGGSVAAAEDHSVELKLHKSGLIEAVVSDAQGKVVSDGVKLGVSAKAKAGAAEKVELAFVPARGRFQGRAKAGVELAPGDVDVDLNVGGKAKKCKLVAAVVAPEPELGGNVILAGAYSAEVFARPSGEIQAFVKDAAGAQVRADAGAKFKARAHAKGGAREEIALEYDLPRACFHGKAKAGVELAPGPIELVVDAKAGAGIGRLENIALSADASHGGQVVAVGDYSVELVAKGDTIHAFVFDASGKAHAAGDLDLKLDIGADAASSIALKWDAPSLSYSGKAAAKLDLALQPIRVSLAASGKAFLGAVASLDAAAKANLNAKVDANAKLDADAKLGAGAKLAADAKAKVDPKLDANVKAGVSKAANASINVTPPKVDVKHSASAGAKAGGGAKASAGFSIGTK